MFPWGSQEGRRGEYKLGKRMVSLKFLFLGTRCAASSNTPFIFQGIFSCDAESKSSETTQIQIKY